MEDRHGTIRRSNVRRALAGGPDSGAIWRSISSKQRRGDACRAVANVRKLDKPASKHRRDRGRERRAQREGRKEISPAHDPYNGIWVKCEGARKGQLIIGMTVLWGLRPDQDGWSGGSILSPMTVQTFNPPENCPSALTGAPHFGQTITWLRDGGG